MENLDLRDKKFRAAQEGKGVNFTVETFSSLATLLYKVQPCTTDKDQHGVKTVQEAILGHRIKCKNLHEPCVHQCVVASFLVCISTSYDGCKLHSSATAPNQTEKLKFVLSLLNEQLTASSLYRLM